MNRHAPLTKRRKDHQPTMTNADTTTEQTAAVAEQGAHVAPEKASLKKPASSKRGAPKGQKSAKSGKTKAAPKKTASATKAAKPPKKATKPKAEGPREGSKTAMVLALIQRAKGATLAEIMKATSWQAHSVRGFMAGAMKKAGYTVESFKPEGGERTYSVKG